MCTWSFTFPVFRAICTHLYLHWRISGSKQVRNEDGQVSILSEIVIATHTLSSSNGYPHIILRQEGAGSRAGPASPNPDAKRWRPRRLFFKKQMLGVPRWLQSNWEFHPFVPRPRQDLQLNCRAGHPNPEQQETGRGASVALGCGKQWGFDPLERLEGASPLLQC